MRVYYLISAALVLTVLGGCAMPTRMASFGKPAPTLTDLLAESEKAIAANQDERATTLLKSAAAAFPGDKQPWLRLAKASMNKNQHGAAIAHALQALERDPADRQAHNIVAGSSLRLAAHSLGELGDKANWSYETQDMGRQLLGRQLLASLDAPEPVLDAGPLPQGSKRTPQAAKRSTFDDIIRNSKASSQGK